MTLDAIGNDFPLETQQHIFKDFSPLEYLTFRLVSAKWLALVESLPSWKSHCINSFGERVFKNIEIFPAYARLLNVEPPSYFRIYFLLRQNFFKFVNPCLKLPKKMSDPNPSSLGLVRLKTLEGEFLFVTHNGAFKISPENLLAGVRLQEKDRIELPTGLMISTLYAHSSGVFVGTAGGDISHLDLAKCGKNRNISLSAPGAITHIAAVDMHASQIVLSVQLKTFNGAEFKNYFYKICMNGTPTTKIITQHQELINAGLFLDSTKALCALKDGGLGLLDLETETFSAVTVDETFNKIKTVALCAISNRIILATTEGSILSFDKKSIDERSISLQTLLPNPLQKSIEAGIKRITPIGEIGFCVHYALKHIRPVLFNLKGDYKVGSLLQKLKDPIWLANGQVYYRDEGIHCLDFNTEKNSNS